MTLHTDLPIVPFAIALAIGALVGLEREKRKAESQIPGVGGIRTFILYAMSGAVSAWLSAQLDSPWIFLVCAFCSTAMTIASYVVHALRFQDPHGLTTEIAALVTFLLGGVAVSGHPELAVALGILTSAVLAYKQPIHRAVGWLSDKDVHAILKLLIATFIVLPVLPDRTIDPWEALNPYKMWWIVILISALSLVGYVASRWIGEQRALPLTGLCGGLVSSTVVSLEFAKRSRENPEDARWADALASGVLAAWFVMFSRIAGIVAVLNLPLLIAMWPPLAAMGLATAIMGLVYFRRTRRGGQPSGSVALRNPFSLLSAIKFALFFAVVLLVVKIVQHYFHGQGLLAVAALAGLTDVDAITLSMAEYGRTESQRGPAAMAIAVAALANTLIKAGFAVALGSSSLRRRMVLATVALMGAGVAAVLATG